jgi:hypothetical protein
MEKKILKAIRKVLKETRYEDLKNNIESRRNRGKNLNNVLDSIEITKSTIKDVLSLNFFFLKHKKKEWDFLKTTSSMNSELGYLKDIIHEIKKRDETKTLKKEDLEYYGFDYDTLIEKLDTFLTEYEKAIIDRGGYVKDKDDEDFNALLRLIKPLRKLKDLLEGLE